MFSKACEYAIRAVVCIAGCGYEGRRMGLKEIAERTDSPEAFTAKILQKMSRAGLVLSMKGPGGGFEVTPELAKKVRLSDIVSAIDGDRIYTGCALGLSQCNSEKPCPLHDHFIAVREDLRTMLEGTTLQDLVDGLRSGSTFLRR
ncbi:MAG: Rrf2 family transcriptional regulator [Flavobacteriales bacterium]|nr:Rrf2 family transcriptional regulator [Flavobacteriales bacterium]